MTVFTLVIESDNDAFYDDPQGEIARMLKAVSAKLSNPGIVEGDMYPLFDVNGNRVGRYCLAQ